MKKYLTLFLLFFCGVSLFSQSPREAKIFVPPITGTGRQGDASFFYNRLTNEVVIQYYSLVRTSRDSDFMLRGIIEPSININVSHALYEKEILRALEIVNDYNRNLQNPEEYIFLLELTDSATDKIIAAQSLVYNTRNDASVGNLVSVMVYNLLSSIPEINEINNWRNKWLFLGLSGMWAPRIYTGEEQSVNWVNFGLGFQAEFHFLNFMSMNLELQFVRDCVVVSRISREEHTDLMLEIPVSLKFVIKPLNYLILEPYGGISYNISLMGTTQPSPLSWFAGFQFGIKAGPGIITIDPRFSMDIFKSIIVQNQIEYNRDMIQIAVGYKFGFFSRNPGRSGY